MPERRREHDVSRSLLRARLRSAARGGVGGVFSDRILSGLIRCPLEREERVDVGEGPATFELVDDVSEVGAHALGAEGAARRLDEGVGDGESMTAGGRASEDKVLATECYLADCTLHTARVEFETPVREAAPEKWLLIDEVGDRFREGVFGPKMFFDFMALRESWG